MEEFLAKLNEYLAHAEQAIADVTPAVWESTLLIIRAQGLRELFLTLAALAASGVFAWYAKRLWAWGWEHADHSDGMSLILGAGLPTLATGAWTMFAIYDLFDLNMWLSVIEPELAVVYRVGEAAGIF